MYIDRNQDSITIEHSNDLPKYRCEYPNQRERVAHYCQEGEDYQCYNSVYHAWYDAYEARTPLSDLQPILCRPPVIDPASIKPLHTQWKVLTKTWNDEYKKIDKAATTTKVKWKNTIASLFNDRKQTSESKHKSRKPKTTCLRPCFWLAGGS